MNIFNFIKRAINALGRPYPEERFMYDGSLDNLLFVSKSTSHPDPQSWVQRFRQGFARRFTLICDDDFRGVLQDPINPYAAWVNQFRYTRASHAMIVVMGRNQFMSVAQEVEIADAGGRNIPIAFCRTA